MGGLSHGSNGKGAFARKALACIASIVLAAGLVPGVALADGGGGDTATDTVTTSGQYDSVNVARAGNDPTYAIDARPATEDVLTIGVAGDVAATGGGNTFAIHVFPVYQGSEKATAVVSVGGGASAKAGGTYHARGVFVEGGNGEVSVSVEGPVKAEGASATGLEAIVSNGSSASVSAGSVEAVSSRNLIILSAIGVKAVAYEGSSATIAVAGDVTAGSSGNGQSAGIYVSDAGRADVLVGGTVKAGSVGVAIGDGSTVGNKDVTAWKIEAPVVAGSWSSAKSKYVEDDALAKAINYIVRVDDVAGATLSATGTGTRKAGDVVYQVAKAGERVNLAISLLEGYDLAGAYCKVGDEQTALSYDEAAKVYYLEKVPDGGGVTLTAQAVKKQLDYIFKDDDGTTLKSGKVGYGETPVAPADPTKAATDQYSYEFAGWDPELGPVKAATTYVAAYKATTRQYTMSFDLGGGTVGGKSTYAVDAPYGSTITLPAPEREGYEFLYWEGSRYNAGDKYEVEGPHAFKAVWKEREAPAPEPGPAGEKAAETKAATQTASTGSSSSGSSMPQAGDTAPVIPAFATLLLAAAAIGASRAKLRPARDGRHARH